MRLSAKTVLVTAKNCANDKVATTHRLLSPACCLALLSTPEGPIIASPSILHLIDRPRLLVVHRLSPRTTRYDQLVFLLTQLPPCHSFPCAAVSPFVLGWSGLLLVGVLTTNTLGPRQREAEDSHHKNARSLQFQV